MSGPLLYTAMGIAGVGMVLILAMLRWPAMHAGRAGKGLSFLAFFIFPSMVTLLGSALHLESSKSTTFCLSCHVMEPYGQSLYVDDREYVGASHFQNKYIPREQACFTCHTTYTMFGDAKAKLQGLKHLYVNYLGTIPSSLELYQPYRNRECLSCHGAARAFEENDFHIDIRTDLANDAVSCLECHAPAHDVEHLDQLQLWEDPSDAP